MQLILADDYDKMSRLAADIIKTKIKTKENTVLGFATGSSPLGLYNCLADDYRNNEITLKNVIGFNLDEYIGLSGENHQSFRYYLEENLVKRTDFDKANLNVLDGCAKDSLAECEQFEHLIEKNGGIDLQILGLGEDGHIGFNEPCSYFPSKTHEVDLKCETIQSNARFFQDLKSVPKKAYTMGIGTIMKSKQILLIVSGSAKAEILRKAILENVTPQIPASILQFHPDCTVIGDKDAMKYVAEWECI